MKLINPADKSALEVVNVYPSIGVTIANKYNYYLDTTPAQQIELRIDLTQDSEYNTVIDSEKALSDRVLLVNNPTWVTTLVEWPNEGEQGYDYNWKFFVTNTQFSIIMTQYSEYAKSLFEGIINPMIRTGEGVTLYVNTFAEGAKEMLESAGIVIIRNPNKPV